MGNVTGGIVVGLVCALTLGCGAADDPSSDGQTGEAQEELWGNVNQNRTGQHDDVTAFIMFTANGSPTGSCTGTLVSPSHIVTAAHCVCGGNNGGNVVFANANGDTVGQPLYPILGIVDSPGWTGACPFDTQQAPFDVAVMTIGPSPTTGALPPSAPPPFTAPVPIGVNLDIAPIPAQETWAIGMGSNSAMPFSPDEESGLGNCIGCGVRRAGKVLEVRAAIDACGFLEADCWETTMWVAPSISVTGQSIEISNGDSGGPLIFGVGTPTPMLNGVASNWCGDPGLFGCESETDRSRWAATYANAEFLWQSLGLPWTYSLADQRTSTAIFAWNNVYINDRGKVYNDPAIHSGGQIVSMTGNITLGPDAVAGHLTSRSGVIALKDRAFVQGNVRTYLGAVDRINQGNPTSVVTGAVQTGKFTQIEPFGLTIPWSSSNTVLREVPNDTFRSYDPGAHPRVVVRARSTLGLRSGVYVFNSLNVEPDAKIQADTSAGPVWVYIVGNGIGPVKFEGAIDADAGKFFLGVLTPGANIFLNHNWRGTLVAPSGNVDANMITNATLAGSFFVNSFTLHQGRELYRVQFYGDWVPTCYAGYEDCH